LSGFTGSAGFLLITEKDAILATDFRYIEQSRKQSPEYEIFKLTGDMTAWLTELLGGLGIKRLGFEAEHISLLTYRQMCDILWKQWPSLELVAIDGLVESLRAIKEPEEVELISKAAAISDRAFERATTLLRAGMSEIEAAWMLENFLRENGSQSIPFDVIVASGPNAALPHAQPSPRTIKEGEPIVVDFGARVDGYCSDLSRTLCLGKPDETFKKIYNIVLDAQTAVMSIIKEGITGEQADNSARAVIEQAGYKEAFGHSLGHGVGLAPHEAPRLGPGSREILSSGMVFSIEPGIYLPSWGGVRIEDLAVIKDGRLEIISQARKG